MCLTCGCGTGTHPEMHGPEDISGHSHHGHAHDHVAAEGTRIPVEAAILAKNDRLAAGNRALFREKEIFALNLISSPGSGKTTILERTLRELSPQTPCAVIEGDQHGDADAARIVATGVPAVQINTDSGCHLDAHMIAHAAQRFDLDGLRLLFIENVGNLVCPAPFDLGEHHKVVVLSVTEGEDKPLKYPHIFRAADVLLLNKTDLLPYLDFDLKKCREMARRVNPTMVIFELSGRTGAGMEDWYSWLADGVKGAARS